MGIPIPHNDGLYIEMFPRFSLSVKRGGWGGHITLYTCVDWGLLYAYVLWFSHVYMPLPVDGVSLAQLNAWRWLWVIRSLFLKVAQSVFFFNMIDDQSNVGSANGLLQSGTERLHKLMLTKMTCIIVSLGDKELRKQSMDWIILLLDHVILHRTYSLWA